MRAIRINPLKRFGNVPLVDKYIVRPGPPMCNDPATRYQVNGEYHRNLTDARRAVLNWKGFDLGSDLHTVVQYQPGSGYKKAPASQPPEGEHAMNQTTTPETPGAPSVDLADAIKGAEAHAAKRAAKKLSNDKARDKKIANEKARATYAARKAASAPVAMSKEVSTNAEFGTAPPQAVQPSHPGARYEVSIGERVRINVNTIGDLDEVIGLVKKHQF